MALTKCLECGHDISTAASVCPNCGAPNKVAASTTAVSPPQPPPPPPPRSATPLEKGSAKKWWFMGCGCLALIAIIAVALFTGVIGGLSYIASVLPNTHLKNFTAAGEPRSINGELDWGILMSFDLESVSSDPQDVIVEMKVSCSEGQWTQRRTVHLRPNEKQHVTQFFAEPTISATDIRSEAKIVTDSK